MKRYKVLKQKLKSTSDEFFIYRFLSRLCKKTYNLALANIKKNYELNKTYISKYDNYGMLKDNEVSIWLNSEVFQKTIYSANEAYEAYFELLKKNNQKFLMIPFGKLRNKISYLCSLNNIECFIQEESYTSLSSFYDLDPLPIYSKENKEYTFSGKRIKRGLYQTKMNKYINADINGALNIYRKSSVCDMKAILYLLRRGVSTPKRLQVI